MLRTLIQPAFEVRQWTTESPCLLGADLSVALWNARGFGRSLTASPEGNTLLESWVREQQPDVIVIPEGGLPSVPKRRSLRYVNSALQFADKWGYALYWASHNSGQARGGIAVLVKQYIVVREVLCGLDLYEDMQHEGRVVALRFDGFWLLCLYVPHSLADWVQLMHQVAAWLCRCRDQSVGRHFD